VKVRVGGPLNWPFQTCGFVPPSLVKRHPQCECSPEQHSQPLRVICFSEATVQAVRQPPLSPLVFGFFRCTFSEAAFGGLANSEDTAAPRPARPRPYDQLDPLFISLSIPSRNLAPAIRLSIFFLGGDVVSFAGIIYVFW